MHVSFEEPGAIQQWALANGHSLTGTKTYLGEKLPSVNDFDLLVVMGGPQSVNELDRYSYLRDEIALVQTTIAHNKPILGVCLGAQIIAKALGAEVQKSPHKEIGVFPLELTHEGTQDPVFGQFPQSFDTFHWHGEMVNLPQGAVLLAQSAGCPHQIFRYGDNVYGVQCHFELTQPLIIKALPHMVKELVPDTYIQMPEQFLQADFSAINQKIHALLDFLTQENHASENSKLNARDIAYCP